MKSKWMILLGVLIVATGCDSNLASNRSGEADSKSSQPQTAATDQNSIDARVVLATNLKKAADEKKNLLVHFGSPG